MRTLTFKHFGAFPVITRWLKFTPLFGTLRQVSHEDCHWQRSSENNRMPPFCIMTNHILACYLSWKSKDKGLLA